MQLEAIKLELIEWLARLKDSGTIELLKSFKDSSTENDWWDELSDEHKMGIEKGLADIQAGKVVTHDDVTRKYGL